MTSGKNDGEGANRAPDNFRGKTMFFFGIVGTLLFGWIVFPLFIYKSVDQPIQFSHRSHTGDNIGLGCVDCHSYEKDGRFFGIPSTEKCAGCHEQQLGVSPEEQRLVADYIRTGREIPWAVYSRQPQNVYFSHATHVKLGGLDCQACHYGHAFTDKLRPARINRISGYSLDIFGSTLFNVPSTPSRGMRMDDCSGCHRKNGVKESCLDCHK
jgi:menaquinone reductase, multiheme cytochrome c subunit